MPRITYTIKSFDADKGTALVEYVHPTGNADRATTKNVKIRKTPDGDYATGETLQNAIAACAPFASWKDEEDAATATNSSTITALVGVATQVNIADDPGDPVMT